MKRFCVEHYHNYQHKQTGIENNTEGHWSPYLFSMVIEYEAEEEPFLTHTCPKVLIKVYHGKNVTYNYFEMNF